MRGTHLIGLIPTAPSIFFERRPRVLRAHRAPDQAHRAPVQEHDKTEKQIHRMGAREKYRA